MSKRFTLIGGAFLALLALADRVFLVGDFVKVAPSLAGESAPLMEPVK